MCNIRTAFAVLLFAIAIPAQLTADEPMPDKPLIKRPERQVPEPFKIAPAPVIHMDQNGRRHIFENQREADEFFKKEAEEAKEAKNREETSAAQEHPAIKYHREKTESRNIAIIGGVILGLISIVWAACRRNK